jgi:hypothetical protein
MNWFKLWEWIFCGRYSALNKWQGSWCFVMWTGESLIDCIRSLWLVNKSTLRGCMLTGTIVLKGLHCTWCLAETRNDLKKGSGCKTRKFSLSSISCGWKQTVRLWSDSCHLRYSEKMNKETHEHNLFIWFLCHNDTTTTSEHKSHEDLFHPFTKMNSTVNVLLLRHWLWSHGYLHFVCLYYYSSKFLLEIYLPWFILFVVWEEIEHKLQTI